MRPSPASWTATALPSNTTLTWSAATPAGIVNSNSLRLAGEGEDGAVLPGGTAQPALHPGPLDHGRGAAAFPGDGQFGLPARLAAVNCTPPGAADVVAASTAVHAPGQASTRSPAAAAMVSRLPANSPSTGTINGTPSTV